VCVQVVYRNNFIALSTKYGFDSYIFHIKYADRSYTVLYVPFILNDEVVALVLCCVLWFPPCLSRDANRGLCCWPVSVTFLYCIQTAKDIVKLLSVPGSPIILLFRSHAPVPNSEGNPFGGGVKYTGSWKNYLGNGTRPMVVAMER